MIRPEHVFPVALMIQYLIASVIYFYRGNPWLGCYWDAALVLTFCVTFKK